MLVLWPLVPDRRPPPTKPPPCYRGKNACVKDAAGLRPRLHPVWMTSRWEAKQGVSGGNGETCKRARCRTATVPDHTTKRGGRHQEKLYQRQSDAGMQIQNHHGRHPAPAPPGHHPTPVTPRQCELPPPPRPPLSETAHT